MSQHLEVNSSQLEKLGTAREWLAFYTEAAKGLREAGLTSSQVVTELSSVIETSIWKRTTQLRNSSTRNTSVNTAGRAGGIPFGKLFAINSAVSIYSAQVLKAFGLNDDAQAVRLYTKANQKAGNPTTPVEALAQINKKLGRKYRKEVLDEMWLYNGDGFVEELTDSLAADIGEEAADHVIEELVHVIPFAGQLFSAGRGAYKCDKKLEKALVYLSKAALDYHMTVLLPLAIRRK